MGSDLGIHFFTDTRQPLGWALLSSAFVLFEAALLAMFWLADERAHAGEARLQVALWEGQSSIQSRLEETERIRTDLIGTVSLSLDYAGSAKVGDWVASEVEVQKTGARLAFANCYLVADGTRIVRASAIFALSASPK